MKSLANHLEEAKTKSEIELKAIIKNQELDYSNAVFNRPQVEKPQ